MIGNPQAAKLLAQDPASQMLGIDIVEAKAGYCKLTMTIGDDMTNGYDVCHGGFIFSLADTAVAFACAEPGKVAVSASSNIEFVAPARLGDVLSAVATINERNGRSCYCDIRVSNQNDETVALVHGRQVVLDER